VGSRGARCGPSRRTAAYALTALALAAISSGAAAQVRVLLVESSEGVLVAGLRLTPDLAGLRAGEQRVGPQWRVGADEGPHQVNDLRVRGSLVVQRTESGLRVVNRVPLEDYVVGTLGGEIYPSWDPETLKAQAVVARTYTLHQRARRAGESFDVRAGTGDQVYGGVDAETPAVRAAVRSTRGEVLVYGGDPILAAFHSASGGQTASAEEVWGRAVPYLLSRPVPDEEDSPDTYWRASVSGTTLGRALAPLGLRLGAVRQVRVEERSASGRVLRVHVQGTQGSESLEARALRSALGHSVIRSTLFEVRNAEDGFIFVGSGHGHGVGMSQWGAEAMARRGASYREILEWFYPGTRLVRSDAR
jgi:stage II sporulation protein D